jgi:hypothetical protein
LIDGILRGCAPSELAVEIPMKFELVINLETAKALVPRSEVSDGTALSVPIYLVVRCNGGCKPNPFSGHFGWRRAICY